MKVIEIELDDLITCDTIDCGFVIKNENKTVDVDIKEYLNMPCPRCGANLLTQKDYDDSEKVRKAIEWINKWFGWISFFSRKKKMKVVGEIKTHKGINIKKY